MNVKPKTLEITNFTGRLTRKLNGELNSGYAKFGQSFGYDPFSKPGNLTWLEAPTDITAGAITDLIVDAKPRFESGTTYVYALGNTGNLYKIQPNSASNPNLDSVIGIASVKSNGISFSFGGSLAFANGSVLGSTEKIYVGGDSQVNAINFDGSSEALVGSKTAGHYASNVYRPLIQFIGKVIFGNKNNIGVIDNTGTVTSPTIDTLTSSVYSQLSPALPQETYITDLDISPDGNYLLISTSGISNENIVTVANDRQAASAGNGNVYGWNGSDTAITIATTIPSYAVTALQTYLSNNMFFSNDTFGASLSNGTQKIVSLTQNKAPFSNATLVNGNFVSWINPEVNSSGTGMDASLYYYGKLDEESPSGLWRVMRYTTALSSGFIYQTPVNLLTNNKYMTVNNAVTALTTLGYGKHYFSTFEVNASNTSVSPTTAKLYRFLITSTGTGTPQLGVYETQTQLFSKRVNIKQIRVYTEPTIANNGFKIDCIGSDGSILTNGTFNYTFSAGNDPTALTGSLERINFNPGMNDIYALGIRITNTGTTNMTIKKIEIDWSPSGK